MTPTPDLARARWFKSSHSSGGNGCVEVAFLGDQVGVRDSKNPTGPAPVFTTDEWSALLTGIRDGEFEPPR